MKRGTQCGLPRFLPHGASSGETWRAIIAGAAALVWSAGCQADFCGDLGQVLAAADTAFSSLKSEKTTLAGKSTVYIGTLHLFGDRCTIQGADGKASYYCFKKGPERADIEQLAGQIGGCSLKFEEPSARKEYRVFDFVLAEVEYRVLTESGSRVRLTLKFGAEAATKVLTFVALVVTRD